MSGDRCWLLSVVSQGSRAGTAELLKHLKGQHLWRLQAMAEPASVPGTCGVLVAASGQALADSLRLINEWRNVAPGLPCICVAFDVDQAQLSSLLQAGTDDLLAWPCSGVELAWRMERATQRARQPSVRREARRIPGFLYGCTACEQIAEKLPALANSTASVLIIGETGTGKEVIAQALHYLSPRAAGPCVAVNCAAIPAELVESELFGHTKGAYTTALASRTGLVGEAEGGTLFLDDIDCLPLPAQGKLLRFLQEFEYRAVGANTVHRADLRVIAASNRDLRVIAQQGGFRQDLFFRLSVLRVALPPLRQRGADIALLARHFLGEISQAHGRLKGALLSPAALHKLQSHGWPGNVRELRHVIERAVLLAAGPDVQACDIEIDGEEDTAPLPLDLMPGENESFQGAKKRVVDAFERRYIEDLLTRHHGNVTHAASAAQKNRRAFFELIRKHSIDTREHRVDINEHRSTDEV